MIALGLETSARIGSVAIFHGDDAAEGETVATELGEERGHARGLAPAIDELLQRVGARPEAIDLVVVGLGPGGYTGLRLGLATAKTMAAVLERPILGVPSTMVLAAHDTVPCGHVLTVLDARRKLVYGGFYRRERDGAPTELMPPFLRDVDQLVTEMTDSTYVVGDGFDVVNEACGGRIRGDRSLTPDASDLLSIGLARYRRGERDNERDLLPLYLRPSEAEIRWEQRWRDQRANGPKAKGSE